MNTNHEGGLCTAILLAAGKGRRMGLPVPKQYMDLRGYPLLAWSLCALASSSVINDIVLVIPEGDEAYIRSTIIPAAEQIRQENAKKNRYKMTGQGIPADNDSSQDVHAVQPTAAAERSCGDVDVNHGTMSARIRTLVSGGAERYDSVYLGLQAIDWPCDYVFIHDGARPLLDQPTINRLYTAVQDPSNYGTAVAAIPCKDTVKITDERGFVASTPDRSHVWLIQTPQVFERTLIYSAYEHLMSHLSQVTEEGIHVTDDAMVVELFSNHPVKLVQASYRNIKVTTREDIPLAEAYLR